MEIIWCMVPEIWNVWQTEFFVILGHFLPFYPSNSLKNQYLKKLKKTPRDIIILHKCTKNHDHMLYCSWHMTCDRCNCYFLFWAIFCPFNPLTAQKIKILKNWKKRLEILPFYRCVLYDVYDQMMYGSWDMVHNGQTDERMDGQTDEQKKWQRSVAHLKICS